MPYQIESFVKGNGAYGNIKMTFSDTDESKKYTLIPFGKNGENIGTLVLDGDDFCDIEWKYADNASPFNSDNVHISQMVLQKISKDKSIIDISKIHHLNGITLDNRMDNVKNIWDFTRHPLMDNRSSNVSLPEGIQALPKFFYWDQKEEKFIFSDHPVTRFMKKTGIKVNSSGSKSAKLTKEEKFFDSVIRLVETIKSAKRHGYVSNHFGDFNHDIVKQGKKYNELIQSAHNIRPDIFKNTMINIEELSITKDFEIMYYESFISSLSNTPKNIVPVKKKVDVFIKHIPDYQAYACVKGDATFVWDEKHNDIMSKLTIAEVDCRVRLNKDVCKLLSIPFVGGTKNMYAIEIIYKILEKNTVPDNHVIITKNRVKYDFRMNNLDVSTHKLTSKDPPTSDSVSLSESYKVITSLVRN